MNQQSLDHLLASATSPGDDGARQLPGVVFLAKDTKRKSGIFLKLPLLDHAYQGMK